MERKQYMKPEVMITLMEGTTLMAGSLDPTKGNGTLTISNGVDTDGNSWADAKRYNVWEDEDAH